METEEAEMIAAAPEVAPADWELLGEVLPCCQGNCEGGDTQDTPTK